MLVYIMAVNMNKQDNRRSVIPTFIIIFGLFHICVASTSTISTTTGFSITNTTTLTSTTTGFSIINTTTLTSTTTTTIPTTTTIAPLQPPTQLDSNSLIGQCPCDLTGNSCDINCCCDGDCRADDKKAFSQCLPFSYNVDDRLCFRKEIILFENAVPVFSNISDENLFCIYYDNYGERNYYTNPNLVQTLQTFQEYRQQFSGFSFQSSSISIYNTNSSFYQSGDPLLIVFEDLSIGFMGLPRSLTSVDCVDGNPAAYLIDEQYTCTRQVQNCSTPGLNANNYITGFRVVKSPQLFQDFNSSSPGASGFYSLYNNSYTVPVRLDNTTSVHPIQCVNSGGTFPCFLNFNLPSPSDNLNICSFVLKEVHYRIITDGTAGITSVWARVVLENVTSSASYRYMQTFSSSFEHVSAVNTFKRSGNPGYVVGQPVLAGILNRTTDGTTVTDKIELSSDRNTYLTVVKPLANGNCDTAENRISVVFGQNIRTGCFLIISAANITQTCKLMHQTIINAFEFDSIPVTDSSGQYLDNNRYVGLYGNSDISKTGDWVKILYESRPTVSTGPIISTSSCQLSLGMNIQILYVNIGALVNPQPKIIGVSFVYDTPTSVQIRCSGTFCQPGTGNFGQKVEITSSVTFIDVSTPAISARGEPPVFLAKIPYDFFYPFISGAATASPALWLTIALVIASV